MNAVDRTVAAVNDCEIKYNADEWLKATDECT